MKSAPQNRLKQIAEGWHEIEPSEVLRENAVRFLRVHALRAGDALQLAAAFIAAERRPASLDLANSRRSARRRRAQGGLFADRGRPGLSCISRRSPEVAEGMSDVSLIISMAYRKFTGCPTNPPTESLTEARGR